MWCTSTQPASARRPETRWRFHLSRCPGSAPRLWTAFCLSQGKTARGEASEGARRADRRGLSLVGARRHGAVLRATSLRHRGPQGGHREPQSSPWRAAAKLFQWVRLRCGEARLKHREVDRRPRTRGGQERRGGSPPPARRCWPEDSTPGGRPPFGLNGGRSDESRDSPWHRPYGIARVTRGRCRARRSTRNGTGAVSADAGGQARTQQSDAELTAAVRAVIAASPFHGEGHRKTRACGCRGCARRRGRSVRAAATARPARLPTPSPHVPTRPSSLPIPNVMAAPIDGHRDAGGRPRHDRRGDRSRHGRMCGTTTRRPYGTRFEALESVPHGRPRSLRDDGRRRGERAHDAPTTTVYCTSRQDFDAELRQYIVSSPAFARAARGERLHRGSSAPWRAPTDVEDLQQALRTFAYNQPRLGFRAPAVAPLAAFALTTAGVRYTHPVSKKSVTRYSPVQVSGVHFYAPVFRENLDDRMPHPRASAV